MDMRDYTTILIKKTTRDKLKELGKKDESYDKIINRILGNKNDRWKHN